METILRCAFYVVKYPFIKIDMTRCSFLKTSGECVNLKCYVTSSTMCQVGYFPNYCSKRMLGVTVECRFIELTGAKVDFCR